MKTTAHVAREAAITRKAGRNDILKLLREPTPELLRLMLRSRSLIMDDRLMDLARWLEDEAGSTAP